MRTCSPFVFHTRTPQSPPTHDRRTQASPPLPDACTATSMPELLLSGAAPTLALSPHASARALGTAPAAAPSPGTPSAAAGSPGATSATAPSPAEALPAAALPPAASPAAAARCGGGGAPPRLPCVPSEPQRGSPRSVPSPGARGCRAARLLGDSASACALLEHGPWPYGISPRPPPQPRCLPLSRCPPPFRQRQCLLPL